MTYKPKLIEVALPLATINAEAAREKAMRQGHPSSLHQWWARRPLTTARAVIWASLVDDPSGDDTLTPLEQDSERKRLFAILERLVKWEALEDRAVLLEAKAEIDRCNPNGLPRVLDPFGGGGAIPLEAQRLGLDALSGDLNPVAVLIQRAMIEIPGRFNGLAPVHPDLRIGLGAWRRSQGLAADIEAYGRWMRDEAIERIGDLYPKVTDASGEQLNPIAWIWARTVDSPDPAWHGKVPLVASWVLSKKPGKPTIWIEPVIDRQNQSISYEIRRGGKPTFERTVLNGTARCLATGSAISLDEIDQAAQRGQLGVDLMAVVAEGTTGGRRYFAADDVQCDAVDSVPSVDELDLVADLPHGKTRGTFGGNAQGRYYGFYDFVDYFSPRQLVALTTLSDLVGGARSRIEEDALAVGMSNDGIRLRDGGSGAAAYADAIATYLAFAVDRLADLSNSLCAWEPIAQCPRHLFGRQAIPMVWDWAEGNPALRICAGCGSGLMVRGRGTGTPQNRWF